MSKTIRDSVGVSTAIYGEKSMTEDNHILPNGFTYIAVTAGMYGSWAKANDPITAARKAVGHSCVYPNFVSVFYAPSEVNVGPMGGIEYCRDKELDKIVAIGFYKLTRNTIKPSKDKRLTSQQFVKDWQRKQGHG